MLNFNQLRAFNEAAKTLNFTEAAKNLYVTQPAVTGMIKQFEDFCNLKLFIKNGSKMHLSPEGQIIFSHTSKLFDRECNLEQVIDALKQGQNAPLHIAMSPSYSWSLFPPLLTIFQRSFPKSKIRLIEGNTLRMIEIVLSHEVQIAIVPKIIDDVRIKFIPFFREEAILIVPPGHHFIESNPVSWDDLVSEPFILKEEGSATRKHLEERLGKRFSDLNVITETNNDKFAKELVRQGKGISFLVKTTVQKELDCGEVIAIPLPPPPVFFDICLAYLQNFHLTATATGFINAVKKVIPRGGAPISIQHFLTRFENIPCPGKVSKVPKETENDTFRFP